MLLIPHHLHCQHNGIMVIDGTFNAVSESVSLFDSDVNNDYAPLAYNNDDSINDGREPSSKRPCINPPKD